MKRLELIKSCIFDSKVTVNNLQTLRIEVSQGIGTIWFNKDKSFNSISLRMAHQFRIVLSHLDADPTTKIILIRSKHPKAFCVGADLKDIFFGEQPPSESSMFVFLQRTFRSVRKPIISIVEGMALGGGLQIAFLCDIILCCQKATFGLPEITLGIMPGLGGTQMLPRIAGSKIAMQKILTGLPMTAAQAHDLNIAICYPAQIFDKKVKEFTELLLNRSSQSMEAAKSAVNSALDTTLDQGLKHETALFQGLFNKQSAKQGLSAFVQKRKPNFRNM